MECNLSKPVDGWPQTEEIDTLNSRAVIQRSLSRLKEPVDRSLNKFKGKSKKLHL